jgi:hypothetical protein
MARRTIAVIGPARAGTTAATLGLATAIAEQHVLRVVAVELGQGLSGFQVRLDSADAGPRTLTGLRVRSLRRLVDRTADQDVEDGGPNEDEHDALLALLERDHDLVVIDAGPILVESRRQARWMLDRCHMVVIACPPDLGHGKRALRLIEWLELRRSADWLRQAGAGVVIGVGRRERAAAAVITEHLARRLGAAGSVRFDHRLVQGDLPWPLLQKKTREDFERVATAVISLVPLPSATARWPLRPAR